MKYAKKMLLVDYNANSSPPKKSMDMVTGDLNTKPQPLVFLDREINSILASNESVDTKLKKYFYALRRLLHHKNENLNQLEYSHPPITNQDRHNIEEEEKEGEVPEKVNKTPKPNKISRKRVYSPDGGADEEPARKSIRLDSPNSPAIQYRSLRSHTKQNEKKGKKIKSKVHTTKWLTANSKK
jgi:hypothetical protein